LVTGAEAQETGGKGQVVLYTGHGGTHSGTVNARYSLKAKEQALDVASRLEALLETDDHTICMTRCRRSPPQERPPHLLQHH
jgi:N-acetylmuramoyl-L-alanine amidase